MESYAGKQRQAQIYENYIRAVGDTPPEPEGKGMLSTLFDWLDTPGQAVRGGIANLLGYEDYGNQGILSAMGQGMQKDLDVGQMLDKTQFFKEGGDLASTIGETPAWLAKAATGLIGNIATDPLTFLTGGATGLNQIGSRSVRELPLLLKSGELKPISNIVSDLTTKLFSESPELAKLNALKAKGLMTDAEFASKAGKIELQAGTEAAQPIRVIGSVLDARQKNKSWGLGGGAKDALDEVDAGKMRDAFEKLGLSDSVNPDQFMAKSAIRFRAPFFDKSTHEIPLITKLSEDIFETMGGPLYTAKVRVGDTVDKISKAMLGVEKGDKITQAAKWIGGGLGGLLGSRVNLGLPGIIASAAVGGLASEWAAPLMAHGGGKVLGLAAKIPSQLSRSAAVGGDANADLALREHELSRFMLHKDAEAQFGSATFGLSPEELNAIPNIIEAGIQVDPKNLARGALNSFSETEFQKALNLHVSQMDPERQQSFVNAITRVRDDFSSMADKERDNGILGSVINYYVPHAYEAGPGMKPDAFEGAATAMTKRIDRFDLPRKYLTNDEALTHGLTPKESFKDLYVARLKAHEMAMADKRALERLAYESALPKETYQKLLQLGFSANEEEATAAVRAIKSRGLNLTTEQIKSYTKMGILGEDTVFFPSRGTIREALKKTRDFGDDVGLTDMEAKTLQMEQTLDEMARPTPMTARLYENFYRIINSRNGDPATLEKAIKIGDMIEAPGYGKLTFNPANYEKEKAIVEASAANYEGKVSRLLGRFGELPTDRSNSTELPPKITNFINRIADRKVLTDDERQFFTGVLPNPIKNVIAESWDTKNMLHQWSDAMPPRMQKAVRGITDAYHGYLRILKLGSTVPFPGYHLRNAFSNVLQSAQWMPVGEALSIPNLIKSYGLTRGEGQLIQRGTGKVFTARQLNAIAQAGGLKTGFDATIDLLQSYGDVFRAAAPDVKTKPTNALTGLLDAGWTKMKDMSQRIEEYGREHVLYNLIRDGMSPESAVAKTKELLVDYTTGKTKFERDILTNTFFFYSFARGQAANTLHSLVANPGAITTQLNAMRGVRDLLKDPNALPLPPDWSEKVQSLRTSETGGQYLGMSKAGNPLMLGEVGLPVADITRYINLKTPKSLKVSDLLEAGDQSLKRTMQTTFAQVNPILRAPMEYMFNKSLFFDRPLDDKTLRKIPKWENDLTRVMTLNYRAIPKDVFTKMDDDTKSILRARDNGDGTMTIDPFAMMIMSNLIPGAGRALATVRNLSDADKPWSQRMTQFLSGTKVREVEVEESQAWNRTQQLQEFMRRRAYPESKVDLMRYLANNK